MQLITFIDHIGRNILGELVENTERLLGVKNPAIIHVQPTADGRLNVQVIPLYFKEFVSEKNRVNGTTWYYNKSNVVIATDLENDPKLVTQYHAVFAPVAPMVPPAEAGAPKVVKLFDQP